MAGRRETALGWNKCMSINEKVQRLFAQYHQGFVKYNNHYA
jgi:hypothetical protein